MKTHTHTPACVRVHTKVSVYCQIIQTVNYYTWQYTPTINFNAFGHTPTTCQNQAKIVQVNMWPVDIRCFKLNRNHSPIK